MGLSHGSVNFHMTIHYTEVILAKARLFCTGIYAQELRTCGIFTQEELYFITQEAFSSIT